jgi:hypothetical protein
MSPATTLALTRPSLSRTPVKRFNAYLLKVTFEAADGERRSAIGGGESIPNAIAAARDELPDGVWTLVRWSPLFGD